MLLPKILQIEADYAILDLNGVSNSINIGSIIGGWTVTSILVHHNYRVVILEDFTKLEGDMMILSDIGNVQVLTKTAKPTSAAIESLYAGFSLDEVLSSDLDLLGQHVLSAEEDPSFMKVASLIAPINVMDTYTFVATKECADKVGFTYGGRTACFDPAIYDPAIADVRDTKGVLGGLLGGWLPLLRFVYPQSNGKWTEMIAFACARRDLENINVQPVWYRVTHVVDGEVAWTRFVDTYLEYPHMPYSVDFYCDLIGAHLYHDNQLRGVMEIETPDALFADLSKHSLVRAINTRVGCSPKYGVQDRNYGGTEHDGFQDTFNADTTAMLDWGLFDLAAEYVDNYFSHFVRDNGSILYRGPEMGQFGRMLTVIAHYYRLTRDRDLILKHENKINAIADRLINLHHDSRSCSATDPSYGVINGWCEADSCLEANPERYLLPYLSNSAEAARGISSIGQVWTDLGHETRSRGEVFKSEARSVLRDLEIAIGRSMLLDTEPPCIPAVAGAKEGFDTASKRDPSDPQFRAYRTYMELLHSGVLSRDQVSKILNYREAHRDILLGVPAAYGFNSGEMGGFLAYGHGYGLIQHDFIREFLLLLYSLAAHQYTRGTWTAPETRRLNPDFQAAPYCVPAQLTVPILVRWMLVFEDPAEDKLWLCKATPRDWLANDKVIKVSNAPTRWGKISFQVKSNISEGCIKVSLQLPDAPPALTLLRLRAPAGMVLHSVELNGLPWSGFDPVSETISIPGSCGQVVSINAIYQ